MDRSGYKTATISAHICAGKLFHQEGPTIAKALSNGRLGLGMRETKAHTDRDIHTDRQIQTDRDSRLQKYGIRKQQIGQPEWERETYYQLHGQKESDSFHSA